MNTKAIFRSARALQALGMATLQFNFRGVGHSQGSHDEGRGEKEDVRSCIDFVQAQYPRARLGLLGFSFGAWVGLEVGAADARIEQLIGMGIPLRQYDFSFLKNCTKPKLILQGSADEFGPPGEIQTWFKSLAEPKQLALIEGSSHLFEAWIPELQRAILSYFLNRYGMAQVNAL